MKAVLCLVFLAAAAMAVPVDPIVSEAKLMAESGSSHVVTAGNGMYNPVHHNQVVVPMTTRLVSVPMTSVVDGSIVYPRHHGLSYVLA